MTLKNIIGEKIKEANTHLLLAIFHRRIAATLGGVLSAFTNDSKIKRIVKGEGLWVISRT